MIVSYNVDLKSIGFNTLDKYIKADHTKYLSQISPYSNIQEYRLAVEKAKVYISEKEVATVICEQSHIDNNTLLKVPVILNKRQDSVTIQTYSNRQPILSEPRPVLGGSFQTGDIIWNTDVAKNKCLGWMCVESGSPGKWLEFGQLRSWYNEIQSMTYLPQASELQLGRQVLLTENSGNSSLWVCKKVRDTYEWCQQDYPVGTTSERPTNPQEGYIRYNTDLKTLEWWLGNAEGWTSLISERYLLNLDMGHIGSKGKRTFAILKGTTAQCKQYLGTPGELTYDTETHMIYAHDGITRGGIPAIQDLDILRREIAEKYVSKTPKRIQSGDLNTIVEPGYYAIAEAKNSPYSYGRLHVIGWDTSQKWVTQIFYSDIRNEVFNRCTTNAEATSWSPWQKGLNVSDADARYATKADVLTSRVSEPLIADDTNIIQVGTGSVNIGASYITKDYRNQMKRSLVTVTDVIGNTQIRNKRLWDVNLSNIATYTPSDVVDILNQQVLNNESCYYDTQPNRLWVNSASREYGYVQYRFTVKPYTDYMVCFDAEERSGNSWVAVAISEDGKPHNVICDIGYVDGSTSGIFNTGDTTIIYIRFYSNVNLREANKEVVYTNAKLIKVKDYWSGDLILRSLPNGVTDELRNGKPIKRIGKYTLTGYENWSLVDSTKPNTNGFLCNLPDAIPNPDKSRVCLQNNKYPSVADSELYDSDKICMSMGGDSGQLVFRVGKGLDSVDSLKDHLRTNETDITVYYEITPRVYNVEVENKLDKVALGLIADSGDELILGSPVVPITSSHVVQLSTQAQIQELQDNVSRTNKSLGSKLKNLLNAKFHVEGDQWYLKLPTLLGGMLLQGGKVTIQANNVDYVNKTVNFPLAYSKAPSVFVNSRSNAWIFGNATSIEEGSFKLYGIKPDGSVTQALDFNWFSIGLI